METNTAKHLSAQEASIKPRLVKGNETKMYQDAIARAAILEPADALVFLVLMSFVDKHADNDQPTEIYPEMDTIVRMTRLNIKTVRKAMRHLRQLGVIVEQRRYNKSSVRFLAWPSNVVPFEKSVKRERPFFGPSRGSKKWSPIRRTPSEFEKARLASQINDRRHIQPD
jgi:hypothetical protein